jgi:hypothetical protein
MMRKRLDHTPHFAGRFGAIYFITICCQRRGSNQLCHDETADVLAKTARIYHERARWNLNSVAGRSAAPNNSLSAAPSRFGIGVAEFELDVLAASCDAQIRCTISSFRAASSRHLRSTLAWGGKKISAPW